MVRKRVELGESKHQISDEERGGEQDAPSSCSISCPY